MPVPERLLLPLGHQRPVAHRRRDAQDRSRTTYERDAALRAAVGRRRRHRGRRRGAARRLAHHRPGGRRPSSATSPTAPAPAPSSAVTTGTAALHVGVRRGRGRPRRRGRHDADDLRGDRVVAPRCSARTVVFADVEEDTAQPRPGGGQGRADRRAPRSSPRSTTPATRPSRRSCAPWRTPRARCCWRTPRTRSARATAAGRSGTLADLTTFSFFPTKNLTTAEGGAVASADPALATRAAPVPQHRPGPRARPSCATRTRARGTRRCTSSGLNYRLPDVLCALGLQPAAPAGGVQGPPRRDRPPLRRAAWPTSPALRLPARRDRRRPGLAPLPAPGARRPAPRGLRAAAAARASASRSTTSRSTGTRSSRTSATGAGMCPNAEASTPRSCRCRCSPTCARVAARVVGAVALWHSIFFVAAPAPGPVVRGVLLSTFFGGVLVLLVRDTAQRVREGEVHKPQLQKLSAGWFTPTG